MLYRKIKKTGEELSILGFGCMRFKEKKGKIIEELAIAQIRAAIDKGVNYFDTAMPYHLGESEVLLGKALLGYRDKVNIATKLTPVFVKSREDMDRIFSSQLKNLQTEVIDYYLLHALEEVSWKKMQDLGALAFLEKLKKEGKIRNIGFSFHGDLPTFKAIIDAYDWDFTLIQYNILDEKNQAGSEGLDYAANKGLGVMIMEPLRGGNLATKVPKSVEELYDKSLVKKTAAEWSFCWIWNHPGVTLILSGMNAMQQVEENCKVASGALPSMMSEADLQIMEEVKTAYRKLMKIDCTGCRYCLPCPYGVNIPQCFEIYNDKYLFEQGSGARFKYALFVGGGFSRKGLASQCKRCGRCEPKCPQSIAIMDRLAQVAAEFEGFGLHLLVMLMRFFMFKVRRKNVG